MQAKTSNQNFITDQFIQGFHAYLLGEKKMGQNSCTKHLKFLKKLLNLAVANSYISYNPVNAYKVEREPVEVDFLNEEELRKIINFDTPCQDWSVLKTCSSLGASLDLATLILRP